MEDALLTYSPYGAATGDFPRRLAEALAQRQRFVLSSAERSRLRAAAVMLLLVPRNGDYNLVFTRRTDTVETHKGQISFPGGRMDPEDESLAATALRETWEEVGVNASTITLLGLLDDLATNSNFAVTPWVGLATRPPVYIPCAGEVAEVFEAPLGHLLDPANRTDGERPLRGRMVFSPSFRYHEHDIWGVTARILIGFLAIAGALPRP